MKLSGKIEALARLVYVMTFICAVALITKNTFGYGTIIRWSFIVLGPIGIGLGFYLSKNNDTDQSFNPLFWLGILCLFIGVVLRITEIQYYFIAVIGGAAITGISYFFNPAQKETAEEDDLLDR